MTLKRTKRHRATKRPLAIWSVPIVLAHRLPMLWMMAMNPTPRRRREARRMVIEKIDAAVEGALAMQMEALKQAKWFWLSARTGGVTGKRLARAGKRVLEAGAAPANRRLHANARRLSQLSLAA